MKFSEKKELFKKCLKDAKREVLREDFVKRILSLDINVYKKMKYYSPEYIECLFKDTGTLFQSKDELYRLLYGGYANPDEFGKRPLSKFIKDIYQNTKEGLGGFDIFSNVDVDT